MNETLGNTAVVTTPEQHRAIERFYHYEARLLDSREYQQWLTLISPDIQYCMPSRVNVQVDNRQRGKESMLALDNELEGPDSMGSPIEDFGVNCSCEPLRDLLARRNERSSVELVHREGIQASLPESALFQG